MSETHSRVVRCARSIEWDAAHRVLRHESKCAHLHGHRYRAVLEVIADELDAVGRVVDFGVLKSKVGNWIDHFWDHATLVNANDLELVQWLVGNAQRFYVFDSEPTAENIAAELLLIAQRMMPGHLTVDRVRVWETPNCWAEAVRHG